MDVKIKALEWIPFVYDIKKKQKKSANVAEDQNLVIFLYLKGHQQWFRWGWSDLLNIKELQREREKRGASVELGRGF